MQVMNKMLNVALGERSYPIHIGVGILAQAELILPYIKQKKVVVVTNTTVAPLYLELLRSTLKKGEISILPVILPDGEQFKTWETLNLIFDAMLEGRCERGTTLIALGGGVIGDMGGLQPPAINAECLSFKFRQRSCLRSTHQLAARQPSIIRSAKI